MSNRTNRGGAVLFVTLFMAVMAEAWIFGADNVDIETVIQHHKAVIKHTRSMVSFYGEQYRKQVSAPDPEAWFAEYQLQHSLEMTEVKREQAKALAVGLEILEQVAAETKPGPVGQCQWCNQYRGLAFIQGTGWLCANCDFDRISEPNDSGPVDYDPELDQPAGSGGYAV